MEPLTHEDNWTTCLGCNSSLPEYFLCPTCEFCEGCCICDNNIEGENDYEEM